MEDHPTVIYVAGSVQQAYMLKNLLAEQGIRATVTNETLEKGSGKDAQNQSCEKGDAQNHADYGKECHGMGMFKGKKISQDFMGSQVILTDEFEEDLMQGRNKGCHHTNACEKVCDADEERQKGKGAC